MKKALMLLPLFLLVPSVASATPFVKDSYIATDSSATSSFAGNVAISGNTHLNLGNGLLRLINGVVESIAVAGSDGEILFNDGGNLGTESGFRFNKDPGGGRLFASLIAATTAFEIWNGGSIDFYTDNGNTGLGGIYMNDGEGKYFFSSDGNGVSILDFTSLSGSRIYKFLDISGTVGLLEANQTWSGENVFSRGASATTTVTFGGLGDSSSNACFNTKNTTGDDVSFYFVGTSMVVEANTCR